MKELDLTGIQGDFQWTEGDDQLRVGPKFGTRIHSGLRPPQEVADGSMLKGNRDRRRS